MATDARSMPSWHETLTPETARRLTQEALNGADDGELFIETRTSESLVFDDGHLKSASFDKSEGFGLRFVAGEATGYAHSTELSPEALQRAAATVTSVKSGRSGTLAVPPVKPNAQRYSDIDPVATMEFAEKIALLERVDEFARKLDPRVCQVNVSISGEYQQIDIIRADNPDIADARPLVRLNISVVAQSGDKRGSGNYGIGGRDAYTAYLSESAWQEAAREAVRQSLVALEAKPAPAGEMAVVLGPGWPGILLHEAIGHGLEGDFNRKGTSAFAGLMGERIASPGVSVVDDGTINDRRGSLTIDDEGTPANCTTLIEDGILVGFMQDRLNARLSNQRQTGNGRRQSFAHCPMPRMTNTYMLNGERDPGEILAAVKNGLLAVSFGGGQVDITSGKFVFSCTEAYLIENGKVTAPVKGATLIGSGAEALTRISMVGNDMALDPGIGTCGKLGQGVPVGVGQPTILLDGLTVGGTSA